MLGELNGSCVLCVWESPWNVGGWQLVNLNCWLGVPHSNSGSSTQTVLNVDGEGPKLLYPKPSALGVADMILAIKIAHCSWRQAFSLFENILTEEESALKVFLDNTEQVSECCLLGRILFIYALDKPFRKQLSADDYNVCITLKLLICSSNNLEC